MILAETNFYRYADDLPQVASETCAYAPLPPGDHLVTTGEAGFLNAPLHPPRTTRQFRLLAGRDLTLLGFRTFLTAEGEAFTDESLDPDWDWGRYAAHFQGGAAYEDYRAEFRPDGLAVEPGGEPVVIEEPVTALCANEPSNYGSWLFRILPKLIALPDDGRPLFVYCPAPWQQKFLRFFARDREIVPHQPWRRYLLKDAQVATARNAHVFFDDQTRGFYRRKAERVKEGSGLRKIYLSRLGQRIRPLLNEAALEEALKAEGFEIVHPEALRLGDRIRAIRDAEVIVCPGGSGLFNLVFARNARLVVDIEPAETWLYAHGNLLRSLRLRHAIVFGEQGPGEDPHRPWTVPVDRVLRAVRL